MKLLILFIALTIAFESSSQTNKMTVKPISQVDFTLLAIPYNRGIMEVYQLAAHKQVLAKMYLLEQIRANEGWNSVINAQIEVHLGKSTNSAGELTGNKQKIVEENFSFENWETDSWTFVADKNWEYIRIRVNPVNNNGNKIGGVFIDNLKLYEACETPLNQCNNEAYRCDMLDVDLKKTDIGHPLAYPNPEQNGNDYLRTIKAINLENVKRFEMKIYTSGGSLVRTIDEWYPASEYVWDGRYDGGTQAPEGNYNAVINGLSNDCPNYHLTNYVEKNFALKREYTVFGNVGITSVILPSVSSGGVSVPAITGLDQAHWLNIKIFDSQGSVVLDQSYYNPPSQMILSTSTGNISNVSFAPGTYTIELQMSNNCMSTAYGNNWDHYFSDEVFIGDVGNYNLLDPSVFNWIFTSKPNFPCPFVKTYDDNYLAPRDCCDGSLYIQDVDILNDFNVRIQQNIVFGNNVNFGVNSNNAFIAGNQIIGEPGVYIPLGSNVWLVGGQNTCPLCITAPASFSAISEEELYLTMHPDTNDADRIESINLFPNPAQANNKVYIRGLNGTSAIINCTLLDKLGRQYSVEIINIYDNLIEIRLPNNLSTGVYFVKLHKVNGTETLRLIIE